MLNLEDVDTPLNSSIYVLIPVHNRKQITSACLDNLEACGYLNRYLVVVVDDGSTDGSAEVIHERYPSVEILQGDGTLWWTGAIALGMEYAYNQGAEFVIWLNDDCELSPETLSDLVQFCREHPGTIIGSQGLLKNNPDTLAFGGKRKTLQGYRFIKDDDSQVFPCDLLSGNVVCMPRSVIDIIGYPDMKLTPHYGGDSLYLLRAKKAGFKLYVDARHQVWSLPGESQLYPSDWLNCEGTPDRLIQLVFNPHSGLSWRVWLHFNWEAYSFWGIIMFTKKYVSILIITLLRYGHYALVQRKSS